MNKVIVSHVWAMPYMELVIYKLGNKHCFASIYLCHGYWKLPLAPASQQCQSFITPTAVYSPSRVMHGQKDATAYCQSAVQDIFKDIQDNILQWLDDVVIFAVESDSLLTILGHLFSPCAKSGLKLHSKKCIRFRREIKWCDRLIDGTGVKLDPSSLDTRIRYATTEHEK